MTIPPVDVRDLIDRPGSSRRIRIEGGLEGLGTELASPVEGRPVIGDLLFESVVEGILVSGRLTGTMLVRCARCLTELERPLSVDVWELFCVEPDEDSDAYPLQPEGWIEPDQMVRDVVGVELPFAPLCRPTASACAASAGRTGTSAPARATSRSTPDGPSSSTCLEPTAES